jgi:hypothetical protein
MAIAGLAILTVFGSAACGGGGSKPGVATLTGGSARATTSTTVSKSSAQKLWNEFAACMRQHGVNMADPVLNNNGMPSNALVTGNGSKSATLQGSRACDTQLQAAMKASGVSPRTGPKINYAQAEKFSRCMRAHGLRDFPDPQTGSGGSSGIAIQGGGGPSADLRPDSPAFQRAQKACGNLMPGKAGQSTSNFSGARP